MLSKPDTDVSQELTTEIITTEIQNTEIISSENRNEETIQAKEEPTTIQVKDDTSDHSIYDESYEFATASDSYISDIPEYEGDPYIKINDNIPFFTEEEKKNKESFESYSDLDSLGRCGIAYANLSKDLMPSEDRGEIGDIKPSGWHTVKYPEVIVDNYLYNRSHLIAYSLAGENANEKNLITGTRYLNQETMQIFELQVLDYLRNTDNHVLYRVTPLYKDDNLLASGVEMEAWSVEDNGKGICFNVYCFNVQPGIEIDYSNGESHISTEENYSGVDRSIDDNSSSVDRGAEVNETDDSQKTDDSQIEDDSQETAADYIVNTNTKKIHRTTCSSISDMAEHNKMYYTGTLEELISQGYIPCKICLNRY